MKLKYEFRTEGNYSYCDLTYNNLTFTGISRCHPDDTDMMSQRTGYFIAELRANIQKLRWCRDYEVIPMLKHYKHFYDCLSHSSKFNPETYEAQMILKELKKWEYELKAIRADIKSEREYLKEYIDTKEKLYQRIRKDKNN